MSEPKFEDSGLSLREYQYNHEALKAHVNMRCDYIAQIIDIKFADSDRAIIAALTAQEKAILKAEDAQKAYNTVHNDLSRKMDEQYKSMMPRSEMLSMIKNLEDKEAAIMQAMNENMGRNGDRLAIQEQISANIQGRIWAIGVGITLVSIAASIALHFIH